MTVWRPRDECVFDEATFGGDEEDAAAAGGDEEEIEEQHGGRGAGQGSRRKSKDATGGKDGKDGKGSKRKGKKGRKGRQRRGSSEDEDGGAADSSYRERAGQAVASGHERSAAARKLQATVRAKIACKQFETFKDSVLKIQAGARGRNGRKEAKGRKIVKGISKGWIHLRRLYAGKAGGLGAKASLAWQLQVFAPAGAMERRGLKLNPLLSPRSLDISARAAGANANPRVATSPSALGTPYCWEEVGDERPEYGVEMTNAKLSAALGLGQTDFTRGELEDGLGVDVWSIDARTVVRATNGRWFRPSAVLRDRSSPLASARARASTHASAAFGTSRQSAAALAPVPPQSARPTADGFRSHHGAHRQLSSRSPSRGDTKAGGSNRGNRLGRPTSKYGLKPVQNTSLSLDDVSGPGGSVAKKSAAHRVFGQDSGGGGATGGLVTLSGGRSSPVTEVGVYNGGREKLTDRMQASVDVWRQAGFGVDTGVCQPWKRATGSSESGSLTERPHPTSGRVLYSSHGTTGTSTGISASVAAAAGDRDAVATAAARGASLTPMHGQGPVPPPRIPHRLYSRPPTQPMHMTNFPNLRPPAASYTAPTKVRPRRRARGNGVFASLSAQEESNLRGGGRPSQGMGQPHVPSNSPAHGPWTEQKARRGPLLTTGADSERGVRRPSLSPREGHKAEGGRVAVVLDPLKANENDREKWNAFFSLVSPRFSGTLDDQAKGLAGELAPRFPQAIISKDWMREWKGLHPHSPLELTRA